jgi:16S rRNA (cytosine1402-N4)-methyltransferase
MNGANTKSESVHVPVLLHEVVAGIVPSENFLEGRRDIWYVDGTLGGAHHALSIAKEFHGKLNILGLDRDQKAIERANATLSTVAQELLLECENYRNIDMILARHDIDKVDMILLDLGVSSDELDNSGKGFTFRKDEPLFMTMGDPEKYTFTAKTIVNEWEENNIADIIFAYGEERYSRRIARGIMNYRSKKKIETSGELAEIVKNAVPSFYRFGKIHPATKTFQALRIAVNDELGALKDGLKKGFESLRVGGRMAVISFHSLEDRIVKFYFRDAVNMDEGRLVNKKALRPNLEEVSVNPRSRSAKLRIIEKIK